jgi:hypothetical protein
VVQLPISFQLLVPPAALRTRAWTCTRVLGGVTMFQVGRSSLNGCLGWTHQELQRDQAQLLPA